MERETETYTTDFGGNLLARVEIDNGKLIVINAMDGYGNAISTENITVTLEPKQ